MREALMFGGSGQIGQPLLTGLVARGWRVHALSRRPQPALAGVSWVLGGLGAVDTVPAAFDAVISVGPLDGFAQWYEHADVQAPRVLAFGSTSLDTKHDSVDASERDLVARLGNAEQTVFRHAAATGARATVLRPTLVYGAGRDKSLTQIATLARRLGRFPLPRGGADGLRQPVHVEDLAEAALRVIDTPATFGQAYALAGGETLSYRQMVERTLAALSPPARLLELPPPLFQLAVRVARRCGIAASLSDAAIARMRQDLVFDISRAQQDFGYAPRSFAPTAVMLGQ